MQQRRGGGNTNNMSTDTTNHVKVTEAFDSLRVMRVSAHQSMRELHRARTALSAREAELVAGGYPENCTNESKRKAWLNEQTASERDSVARLVESAEHEQLHLDLARDAVAELRMHIDIDKIEAAQ